MVVNSTGVFLSTKHEILQMMKQDSISVYASTSLSQTNTLLIIIDPASEEGRVPQRGAIVNCASLNSQMSIAGSIAYTTSKHVVMGITKTVSSLLPSHPSLTTTLPLSLTHRQAALEARTHDIRVNAISPGFLLTNLLTPIVGKEGGVPIEAWDALRHDRAGARSLRRLGMWLF